MPRFDDRFARQNRCEPPPEFPLASPYPGIVHHLSGPNGRARTQIHPKTSGSVDGAPGEGLPPPFTFIPRWGFDARTLAGTLDSLVRVSRRAADPHYASTLAEARSSVRAGGMTAGAIRLPGGSYIPRRFVPPPGPVLAGARARIPCQTGRGSPAKPVWGPALPSQQFHVLFDPLFKVLFIFRSLYLCAIGLRPVFSFRWNLPPAWSCIPKQLDSSKGLRAGTVRRPRTGLSPSMAACSKALGPAAHPEAPSPNYNSGPRTGSDFKFELLPLHSPLLGQSRLVSCPPLIDMLKFSGYPCPIRGQSGERGPARCAAADCLA